MERYRVRWSEFSYNEPLKIIIPDWGLIRTVCHNLYLIVDTLLEYKGREIELCIPYHPFITAIRLLTVDKQRLIKEGKAVITLMKTYRKIEHGIIIKGVELWKREKDFGLSEH